MKQVQDALQNTGIPVMAGVWRATSPNQNPPVQYIVYSSTTTEDAHQDDGVVSFRTYIYLNLWSDVDPTEAANQIRSAMYAAGFFMVLCHTVRRGTACSSREQTRCGRSSTSAAAHGM